MRYATKVRYTFERKCKDEDSGLQTRAFQRRAPWLEGPQARSDADSLPSSMVERWRAYPADSQLGHAGRSRYRAYERAARLRGFA